jgi:hypothetical protein
MALADKIVKKIGEKMAADIFAVSSQFKQNALMNLFVFKISLI